MPDPVLLSLWLRSQLNYSQLIMFLVTLFAALWGNATLFLETLTDLWFDGIASVWTCHVYPAASCAARLALAVENANFSLALVSNMINKLSGQPDSYEKKYESIPLSLPSQSDPSSQNSCI